MNTNLTELVFILDRSGSMINLTQETIGGFNSLIEKQKHDGNAFLTTVLFDNAYELLHDHMDIHQVSPLTNREYFTRGSTALFDAIGRTIDSVGRRLSDIPEENRPGKVIFAITTDGCENSSSEYTLSRIKEMITHQRNVYKWEFIFLGANIDALETADTLGISRHMSKTYTASPEGCRSTYMVMEKLLDYMKINDSSSEDYESSCKSILSEID